MAKITKGTTFVNGQVPTASQFNTNFDTIYNEFNGNIDNNNIKGTAAISGSKLADSSIPIAKINWAVVPRAKAKLGVNQTIASGTSGSAVVFDTEVYDIGNCWSTDNGERFIAPENGLYVFSGFAVFLASATKRAGARVDKNGISSEEDYQDITDMGDFSSTKAVNWYWEGELVKNDYLSIYVFQDSGTSRDIQGNRVFARFRKVAE